ncbi:two-component system CheB/CheR fusion protein [Rhizobium sp. PP-CC-3A-592]|nr:two-component system CheB/CheR fusion protein [Rhizobium sp. PP-CC-3A-592]
MAHEPQNQNDEEPDHPARPLRDEPLAIIGIGVSATSLGSLDRIFSGLTCDLGAAYLVVVRQQDGLDVQAVVDVLRRRNDLTVKIAVEGEAVAKDTIFVAGPDDMLTLDGDHLHVRAASEPIGHRATVDTLLISLAEQARERAIAVLLRGLGSDGTGGVVATKKFGGLSIGEVEDEEAVSTQDGPGPFGAVDYRLAADEIATHIAGHVRSLHDLEETSPDDGAEGSIRSQIMRVTAILRKVTGHDFHGYKKGTFMRRVHRRMNVSHIDGVDAYIAKLQADREEVESLFQDLLIGVTQFFRDSAEFEALEREIPRLLEGRGPGEPLRVWVLGCATGEEAYSIAMLLREHMAAMDHPPEVQIFATDLDARALGIARAARYSTGIETQVSPDRLVRWFVREGDTYCIIKELREMCIFSPHSILKDAPFSRMDIVSCRNLLIYLDGELQNRVIPIFHFSLREGGILFLGSSENVTRHTKLFSPVDRKHRLFRRLETATRLILDFPLRTRARGIAQPFVPTAPVQAGRLPMTISRHADAVVERYTPAYVIVDTHYDILHFSGRTGRYLEPAAGAATLNLLSLAHRDLRLDLRAALHRAATEAVRVEVSRVVFRNNDLTSVVNLLVEPLGGGDVTSLIVLFQDAGTVSEGTTVHGEWLTTDDHIQRLETDLRVTRDRLQATIEELESTNEELKSSNEEYQSINEELQSASEEMETSKEEVQSVNEELQTVNGELAHRVTELGRANSDLKNLLEATKIATVFLDNDLRVRSFTPEASQIFHLLETDVGRPLDHVVSRVGYPELQDDVRRVLRSLTPVNRQVSDMQSDRHYAARVLPYRSVDNYIGGAVLTFTDLTVTYHAEAALRRSEQRLQRVLETDAVGVIFMDQGGLILDANDVFLVMSGYTREQIKRHELDWRRLTPSEYLAETEAQMEKLRVTGRLGPYEKEYILADGTRSWLLFAGRDLGDGTVAKFCIDISVRKRAQAALKEGEEQFRLFGEASSDALAIRDAQTLEWVYLTPAFETIYGISREAAMSGDNIQDWRDLIVPEDRDAAMAQVGRVRLGERVEFEYRIQRPTDGEVRWLRNAEFPLFDIAGVVKQIGGIGRDVTEAKMSDARMKVLVGELQHRTRNLMVIVRAVAEKTMESSRDLVDFGTKFRDRLDALARVQSLLSRLTAGDRVTFDELISSELAAHGVLETRSDAISLDGPAGIRLRSTSVQTLALALHELATNAVKYGALSQPDARLTVRWTIEQSDASGRLWLHIDWRESAVVMTDDGGKRFGGGQGRELIERALPYQLKARTSFDLTDDGVHCQIAIPLLGQSPGEHDPG